MSYVPPSGTPPLGVDDVRALANAAGLQIPEEDLVPLGAALAQQLATVEVLDALDLFDVDPDVHFDPRWHD